MLTSSKSTFRRAALPTLICAVALCLGLSHVYAATNHSPEERFIAREGYLSASIQELVRGHGWTLIWDAEDDRFIDRAFSIPNPSLEDGLTSLLYMYQGELVADMYYGNKVVLISPPAANIRVELPERETVGDYRHVPLPEPTIEMVAPVSARTSDSSASTQATDSYTQAQVFNIESGDSADTPSRDLLERLDARDATAATGAVLQVLSVDRKDEAQAQRERLQTLGFDVRMQEFEQGEGIWYRLRVHVPPGQNPETIKKELEKHGFQVWVLLPGLS